MRRTRRYLAGMLALALGLAACGGDNGDNGDNGSGSTGGDTLQTVLDRGRLVCGANNQLAGFGIVDANGEYSGFDVDFCRAIAAALFDDPTAVDFVPLTADQRFTAVQSGEVDVLIRNTTWTATRDGAEGMRFQIPTFYDGQGMMVRAEADYESILDMQGATVCVLSGTTTQLNLTSYSEANGLNINPQTFEDDDTLSAAFAAGQCDGWTSDLSGLAGRRSTFAEGPEALRILPDVISKEPLGPGTAHGDDQWSDIVNWVTIATIQAEEFGIDSTNVDSFLTDEDPSIQRFLGVGEAGSGFDPGLGLHVEWAQRIVRHVGNYAEIFENNVGPNTPLGIQRGVNSLWTEGGLLYPPPFR